MAPGDASIDAAEVERLRRELLGRPDAYWVIFGIICPVLTAFLMWKAPPLEAAFGVGGLSIFGGYFLRRPWARGALFLCPAAGVGLAVPHGAEALLSGAVASATGALLVLAAYRSTRNRLAFGLDVEREALLDARPGGRGGPAAPGPARLLRRGPVSETWALADRYEKRYRVLYPWLPLAGLLKANMPVLDARDEAANARRLRALAVEAPEPLWTSARWRPHPLGLVHESTVALAPLAGEPLDRLLARSPGELPARERARIARAAGEVVRRMHQARIFHRDLYLCHLVWDGRRVGILDVARAAPRRFRLERWRVKDLAALLASADEARAGRRERVAFLRAYAGRGARIDRRLLRETQARARRMMGRGAKG